MLSSGQLSFNCSDCIHSLFEVVIKNKNGEWSVTQNYMTLDEYRRWEKKLGHDGIMMTGNRMCSLSSKSISRGKIVMEKWHPTDDFVLHCSAYTYEGTKEEYEKRLKLRKRNLY